jgi:hypothetical protein
VSTSQSHQVTSGAPLGIFDAFGCQIESVYVDSEDHQKYFGPEHLLLLSPVAGNKSEIHRGPWNLSFRRVKSNWRLTAKKLGLLDNFNVMWINLPEGELKTWECIGTGLIMEEHVLSFAESELFWDELCLY